MKLKERPGTILITVGLGITAIALVVQLLIWFGDGNGLVLFTLGPVGLVIAAIGFGRRVLFALDHLSPVPGYHPAPSEQTGAL